MINFIKLLIVETVELYCLVVRISMSETPVLFEFVRIGIFLIFEIITNGHSEMNFKVIVEN